MATTTTPTLNGSSASDPEAVRAIALRSLEIMRDGTREDFDALIHPEAVNREAVDEPPASRTPGPAGHFATALWLRDAFGDVRWDVHDEIAQGDLAVVHCTMSGRHVRDFVAYGESGEVDEVLPATGERFATTQTHWLRIRDRQVVEHWANRDDLGTAKQLRWVPPSPVYLLRMALAKRRARREAQASTRA